MNKYIVRQSFFYYFQENFLAYFLLFLVAFDPQIPFFFNGIGFTMLINIILIPFILKKFNVLLKENRYFFKISFSFLLIYIFSLIVILIRIFFNDGINIEFILSWFKAFGVFIASVFVYLLFFSKKDSKAFIKALLFIYVLNGIINFVAGTYPEIFSILNFFRGTSIASEGFLANYPYRNSFIAGSGYYSIGTAYGLIIVLFIFHFTNLKTKTILFTISIFFLSITSFIAARTAFFGLFIGIIYILRKHFFYSLILIPIFMILMFFLLELPFINPYKMWILNFFLLYSDSSASHLINEMYFWPGEDVFFLGMGIVNNGVFKFTDGGYMQDILFGGILFMILKLSFLLVFFHYFFKRYPLFIILLATTVLIFHFKGLFLYNNAQGMAALYFISFYLYKLRIEAFLKIRNDNLVISNYTC